MVTHQYTIDGKTFEFDSDSCGITALYNEAFADYERRTGTRLWRPGDCDDAGNLLLPRCIDLEVTTLDKRVLNPLYNSR